MINQFKFRFLTILLLINNLNVVFSQNTTKKTIESYAALKTQLVNPPSEFRSAPLWVWNWEITKEGIDFQLKEFKKVGIGGVFVHPRPGLLTEYLSDNWFDLFNYAVRKGKELDMKVWIYDENSYPSGFAGGHVPAEMLDSYKNGVGLSMTILDKLVVTYSDTIACVLRTDGNVYTDITAILSQEMGKTGKYYIFRKVYPGKSLWMGGFSYVDLLYKGVTEKFLDVTMTKGYARNKTEIGKTIPGIFTDEPNLEAVLPIRSALRWTPDLMNVFKKRWGYKLEPNLPLLYEETYNWKKVRHDYYETLLELFLERWAKPYSEYCIKNNLIFTGHYWEHGWPAPTEGFDEAAFNMYQQMPGVDMLGCKLDSTYGLAPQFGNDRAIRELRSAANQAGNKRTLSETYGGGGWDLNFEIQKQLADWELALGVNFINQHLSFYTLTGVRKFDYPQSFSYHEPWWEHYHVLADYIGRVSMAMSAGNQINKTIVLQPNSTVWMYFSKKDKNPIIDSIKIGFKNFTYRLEQMQVEYDLGSENVIHNFGKVSNKTLIVGKCNYTLVVIPAEMQNIDLSTFGMLQKYLANGGKVLSFRKNIGYVDGIESIKVSQLTAKYSKQWFVAQSIKDEIAQKLLKSSDFSLENTLASGMIYHQRRILTDGQLLFLANTHLKLKTSSKITVNGKYVTKIDLFTGKTYNYPTTPTNGNVSFQIGLEPVGSALFFISNNINEKANFTKIVGQDVIVKSNDSLKVKRESENVLVINYLDLKTAQSDKKNIYFMEAMNAVYIENGITTGNPWEHKIQYKKTLIQQDTLFKENSGFEATYHFQISDLNNANLKSMRAVVEHPELWQVSINGQIVEKQSGSYWVEKQFPTFAIGNFVKSGENTITIKAARMNILAEIMPVYILGDFLVKSSSKNFVICEGNIQRLGSWSAAGLPFYSQSIRYIQNFEISKNEKASFKVKLKKWNGTVAEAFVNNVSAGIISWQPYELDITSLINNGNNEIALKVFGSLKNSFGHFFSKKTQNIYGPYLWNNAPKIPAVPKDYFFNDYGLFDMFELLQTK